MKVIDLERNIDFETIKGNKYRLLKDCWISSREKGEIVTALSQDFNGDIKFDKLYMAGELEIELVQEYDASR